MNIAPLLQYLAFGFGMIMLIVTIGFLATMAFTDDIRRR